MSTANRPGPGPLRVDTGTGLLVGVPYVPSPNCDERPAGCRPQLVVIHGISLPPGEYGGPWIERLFTNRLPPDVHPYFATIAGLRVSAHVLIRRDGGLLQFVPFDQRAWHAGESCWQGRECCNDYSVGIELEGVDDAAYEDVQYEALAGVLDALFAAYPELGPGSLAGHSDIAPGRKTDPGSAFDWPRLQSLAARVGRGSTERLS